MIHEVKSRQRHFTLSSARTDFRRQKFSVGDAMASLLQKRICLFWRCTVWSLAIAAGVQLSLQTVCFADQAETITGSYCYTYSDDESLIEAREKAKYLAIQDAVQSHRVYIESFASVNLGVLEKDYIYSIANGLVKNVKTVSREENNRRVCIKIQGTIIPSEVKNIIKNVERKKNLILPKTDNAEVVTAKIKNDQVRVLVKMLHSNLYFKLHCDYVDSDGDVVNSDYRRFRVSSEDVGKIFVFNFPLPEEKQASSFLVRLTD